MEDFVILYVDNSDFELDEPKDEPKEIKKRRYT